MVRISIFFVLDFMAKIALVVTLSKHQVDFECRHGRQYDLIFACRQQRTLHDNVTPYRSAFSLSPHTLSFQSFNIVYLRICISQLPTPIIFVTKTTTRKYYPRTL